MHTGTRSPTETGPIDACLAIVSDAPYVERGGRFLARPVECRVLETFARHFRETVLVRPRVADDGGAWEALPERYALRALREPGDRWQRPLLLAGGSPPNLPALLEDADVIAARLPCFEGSCALRHGWRTQRTTLVSLHGDWAEAYRADWTGGLKRLLQPWMSARAARLYRRAAARADLLFCVGEALRARYAPQRDDACVFGNFFYTEKDLLERHDACTQEPLEILFVGALTPRKGVRYLIEALALLRDRRRDVRLTLVGDGDQRAALERQAADAGLGDRVDFAGFLRPGPDLWRRYETADVCVLPALGAEGCPNTVAEAMAKSCPVVATRVGSIAWMLADGENGILVEPGRAGPIADAVEALADDPAARARRVAAALHWARGNTWAKNIEQVGAALRAAFTTLGADPRRARTRPGT